MNERMRRPLCLGEIDVCAGGLACFRGLGVSAGEVQIDRSLCEEFSRTRADGEHAGPTPR